MVRVFLGLHAEGDVGADGEPLRFDSDDVTMAAQPGSGRFWKGENHFQDHRSVERRCCWREDENPGLTDVSRLAFAHSDITVCIFTSETDLRRQLIPMVLS